MTTTEALKEIPGHFVSRRLSYLMDQFGPTKLQVARAMGVHPRRVSQALSGNAGWLKTWTVFNLQDWEDGIASAWLY